MAVSQMQRVQIFVHNSHRALLIKDLQDLEIIHINNLSEQKESTDEVPQALESPHTRGSEASVPGAESETKATIRNIQNDLSRLQSTINYLADFEQKKGFIASFLGSGKPVLSSQEYSDIAKEATRYEWRNICDECQTMEDQAAKLVSREGRLRSEREHLSFWSNLDAPIEEIQDTEKTEIRIGIVPVNTYDNLLAEVKSSNMDVSLEVVGKTTTEVNLVVIFLKADEQEVAPVLTKHGFSPVSLPLASGRISDQIRRIDEELSAISDQRKSMAENSAQLASNRTRLMAVYDHLTELLRREEIRNSFAHTDYTFMVDGWARKSDVKKLENTLSKKYDEVETIVFDPSESDEPPVDLDNARLFKPFEMVTRLYGIPHYREIDPTPLFSLFLALGFGICLTDAGYGVVVTLLSLIVLINARRKRKKNDLFGALLVSGLATVLVGTLTGGWFGISGDKLPGFLLKVRLLDPSVKQLFFLGLIVLVGYIEVCFGFCVKMYIYLKERNWIGAFCNQLPWILVMLLAPTLIMLSRMGVPPVVGKIGLAVILLCALTIVVFTGGDIKNPAGRIGMGLFGLYGNITGTFGDTLSYMRLFALGLATGIIASSVNAIAGMVWSESIVSKVSAIAILLVGHPFNITINALGGFIHSMRLQFVEFFTKFYEGGGSAFQPFRRENVYITVSERNLATD